MPDAAPDVAPPEPPDSPDAWYAPDVHDQYELVGGCVATVRSDGAEFRNDVREPSLSAGASEDLASVREHFAVDLAALVAGDAPGDLGDRLARQLVSLGSVLMPYSSRLTSSKS